MGSEMCIRDRLTGLVCWGAARLHPLLGLAVQMFWCGQALAAKGLVQESTNVYAELKKGSLPAARKAVSRIVGRDTEALTAEGVTRAAVETVAENAATASSRRCSICCWAVRRWP